MGELSSVCFINFGDCCWTPGDAACSDELVLCGVAGCPCIAKETFFSVKDITHTERDHSIKQVTQQFWFKGE